MVFTDLLYNVPIDENVCGNSATDLPLWQAARRAYVVAPGRGVLKRASAV